MWAEYNNQLQRYKSRLETVERDRERDAYSLKISEDYLESLSRRKREIDEGLAETEDTISRRLDRVPRDCILKREFLQKARATFRNRDTDDALEEINSNERQTKKDILRYEEKIEQYGEEIRELKVKIQELQEKLEKIGKV